MTSRSWKQIIAIHIMSNISRSKDNQTMKLVQLIEYYKRNIFLEKSYTKCNGETIPRPISKNSKLSISLDQYSKVLYSFFYCTPSWGLSKNIETAAEHLLLPHIELFHKTKRGL